MARAVQTFDDWVRWVFEHPVRDPAWYWEGFDEHWPERDDPETLRTVAEYLGRLFRSSARLLHCYAPAQIEQGIWFLIDPGASGQVFALVSPMVPLSVRRQGIVAIEQLFEKLYARSCSRFFGHLDAGPEAPSPLNRSCYMWWDVAPLCHQGDEPEQTDHLILRVQANILRSDSVACVESALHGLGHMAQYYPRHVQEIIDAFLAVRSELPQCLLEYATAARVGAVL